MKDGRDLLMAGLILGITLTAMALFLFGSFFSLIIGVAGLICAIIGKRKAIEANILPRNATVAVVLSIIGMILSAVEITAVIACVSHNMQIDFADFYY